MHIDRANVACRYMPTDYGLAVDLKCVAKP